MQRHNPSRRSFLGGLVASLLGWLPLRKARTKHPRPQPALAPLPANWGYCVYNANGDRVSSTEGFSCNPTNSFTYDAGGRVTSVSFQTGRS